MSDVKRTWNDRGCVVQCVLTAVSVEDVTCRTRSIQIKSFSIYCNKIQTCQLTRLKWVRPAFEYKTRVTRSPTQNSRGSLFWHFLFRRGLSSGQNSKKIISWLGGVSLPLPKNPTTFGVDLRASGCGSSSLRRRLRLCPWNDPLRNLSVFAIWSKADHPRMRAFSYAWLLPVTLQRWRSHHSICHSWLYLLLQNLRYGRSIFYIAEIVIFDFFAPVTLILTQWPSYTNWTRIDWRYTMCIYELPASVLSKAIVWQTDYIQTDRHDLRPKLYTTPLCRWSENHKIITVYVCMKITVLETMTRIQGYSTYIILDQFLLKE